MTQASLFKDLNDIPLAEKLRPDTFDGLVQNSEYSKYEDRIQSLILWGPPGSGKTSFAKIIAKNAKLRTVSLSAVISGAQQFKSIFEEASKGLKILLLVDEIHHLNKSQQDLFLPHIENGSIVLIGTTTENPSFELRPALLSRCQVLIFRRLSEDALLALLKKAEDFLEKKLPLNAENRLLLCKMSDGDGRYLLNMAENLFKVKVDHDLSLEEMEELLNRRSPIYDKNTEEHYNLISALHKSMRGSDVDAALYWFQRMLIGGENPKYILRRVIRFAVEDVGMADPNALLQANAAEKAYNILGSPEGELAIAQAIVYCATAPKSNAVYTAFKSSKKFASENGSLMPPKYIINAPTKLMKDMGFFEGYIYDPDTKDGFSGQNYFPEQIQRQEFYKPFEKGFEREIIKRLDYWKKLRKIKNGEKD